MVDKIKLFLESIKIKPTNWIIGVSGIMSIRFFLESISNPSSTGYFASDASTLIHYYLFYMTGLVILLIFFRFFIPKWKDVIPQFVSISFILIIFPPIIDWLLSGGSGLRMSYIFISPNEFVEYFFNFFKFLSTTIGIKIEVGLAFIGLGFLTYFVQKDWKRAIISPIIFYIFAFFMLSIPSFISILGQISSTANEKPMVFIISSIQKSSTVANNIHSSLEYSSYLRFFEIAFNFLMGKVLILFLIIVGSIWFFVSYREKFFAVVKNFRLERLAHYMLTIIFGAGIAFLMFPSTRFNWNDWLSFVVLCVAFLFAWKFAVCVNDLSDEKIDKISNPKRPLITEVLSRQDMEQLAVIFFATSVLAGFLAGYTALFFILAFNSLYYVYSFPPTRFKAFPLFSSFIISLCYLSAAMAGFFLVSPIKQVSIFPAKIIVAIIVVITLLSNAKDLKDTEGDRVTGIMTLPVILGPIWGPRIVGILVILSFLLIPIFSKMYVLLVSALPAAFFSYYFINKKPYKEKSVVWTYFCFVVATIMLFIIF